MFITFPHKASNFHSRPRRRLLLIRGTFIDTPTPYKLRIRRDHYCGVDTWTGKIVLLEAAAGREWRLALESLKVRTEQDDSLWEFRRLEKTQAIGVGLVDCHIHAPQYNQLGTKTDVPLMEWLNKYTFPEEHSFRNPTHSLTTYSSLLQRLLRNGTTTAVYFSSNHLSSAKILAETCAAYGQRALVGKTCSDQLVPEYYKESMEEAICDTEEFIVWAREMWGRRGRGALVKPVVTPRFVPTCSWELLAGLGRLARKYDVHVQSHAAESVDEVLLVAGMHPKTPRDIDIFNNAGLLTDKTILAHCCHLNDNEVTDIVEAGAGIVSCPHSNMLFARSVVAITRYYSPPSTDPSSTTPANLGLKKISFGTDISGGPSSSLWHNLRLAIIQDRIPSYYNLANYPPPSNNHESSDGPQVEKNPPWNMTYIYAYHIATVGGAATIGMADLLGVFEVGRLFDAVLVDWGVEDEAFDIGNEIGTCSSGILDEGGDCIKGAEVQDLEEDRIRGGWERFVMGGDDRNILTVWVDGKEVCRRDT